MATRFKDITGQTLGFWTVISYEGTHEMPSLKVSKWLVRCICGNEAIHLSGSLKQGLSTNCGCKRGTHGHTKGHTASKTYMSWKNMVSRCHNPGSKGYAHYTARGITVCDRWRFGIDGLSAFECFLEDMGEKPTPKHTIERSNNSAGYHKDNCKWATWKEQGNNRSTNVTFEYRGGIYSLASLCEISGLNKEVLRARLVRNKKPWPIELAMNTPVCKDASKKRSLRHS